MYARHMKNTSPLIVVLLALHALAAGPTAPPKLCSTPHHVGISVGGTVPVAHDPTELCTCGADGQLTCPKPAARPASAPATSCDLVGYRLPVKMAFASLEDSCNTAFCDERGGLPQTQMACNPLRVARTLPLTSREAGPLKGELAILTGRPANADAYSLDNLLSDVRVTPRAGDAKPVVVGDRIPLMVRLTNTSSNTVKVFIGGDGTTWKFKTTGSTVTPEGQCDSRYAVGLPVAIPAGGVVEVPMPFLTDLDRCRPTQHFWAGPGRFDVQVSLQVHVDGRATPVQLEGQFPVVVGSKDAVFPGVVEVDTHAPKAGAVPELATFDTTSRPPHDVITDAKVQQALKTRLSAADLERATQVFDVGTQTSLVDGFLVGEGCKAHLCSLESGLFVVNVKTGALWVFLGQQPDPAKPRATVRQVVNGGELPPKVSGPVNAWLAYWKAQFLGGQLVAAGK